MRIAWLLILGLALAACAPVMPPLQLPDDCRAESTAEQLVAGNWLAQPAIWRLRQAALLEVGRKKIPLEGFLRLDLQRREARLLALNEMGLVLFDLQVSLDSQQLQRALPQLQRVKGLDRGVAQSLRQIFLLPQPQLSDHLENSGTSQRFIRSADGGRLDFVFDCRGELREIRQRSSEKDWRVIYNHYQIFDAVRLPEEIILNDRRHGIKLSLWTREGKQEP